MLAQIKTYRIFLHRRVDAPKAGEAWSERPSDPGLWSVSASLALAPFLELAVECFWGLLH